MKRTTKLILLILGVGTALFAACSSQNTAIKPESITAAPRSVAVHAKEQPVTPEINPPGDIPDSQAFVAYASNAGHYSLDVPEGWARKETGATVSFVDNLDGVTVTVNDTTNDTTTSLTADSVRTHEVAQLEHSGRAVQIVDVKEVRLPHGNAVLIQYASNSDPDPTTGKQVRLENNAYLFVHNGKLATLRLWAPQGADNVDQWQRMSRSFGWS